MSRFAKILMSAGLVSYLVLFLAGGVLHNHPIELSPLPTHSHSVHFYHNCHCCEHDEDHSSHSDEEHRHECPVCYFDGVISGATLVKAIVSAVALLCLSPTFLLHDFFHLSQDYFSTYPPRAPPALSF